MSRVVEASGAQVLPMFGDERATTSAWAAFIAVNADVRTKYKPYAELASRLMIEKEAR